MKTKTTVTEITHDDIVNLFQYLYSSDYFIVSYDTTPLKEKPECFEDCIAELLLMGKSIKVGDMYADDETCFFGDNPHKYLENEGVMWYKINLNTIKKGLAKAMSDETSFVQQSASHLMTEPGSLDYWECDALLQTIVFGKLIYG